MHDKAINHAYDMGAREERKRIIWFMETQYLMEGAPDEKENDHNKAWNSAIDVIISRLNRYPCPILIVATPPSASADLGTG